MWNTCLPQRTDSRWPCAWLLLCVPSSAWPQSHEAWLVCLELGFGHLLSLPHASLNHLWRLLLGPCFFAHIYANFSNCTLLSWHCSLPGCVSSRKSSVMELCLMFFSLPPLLPSPSSLPTIVSSVRRGPVLFSPLSPQAGIISLWLQPFPETRVQGVQPAQPSPPLFQHAPVHSTQYSLIFPTFGRQPQWDLWRRSARNPRGGGISARGRWGAQFGRRRGRFAPAQPTRILCLSGPRDAALRRQISV